MVLTKKIDVDVETWESNGESFEGKSETFLETEGNQVIITLKIKGIDNENWNKPKWSLNYRNIAAYSIEPQKIILLNKIKGNFYNREEAEIIFPENKRSIQLESLVLVFEDLKNSLPNWPDEIFSEGAEVKLKLGSDWKFKEVYEKKGNFFLSIGSDYEIIKSDGTVISFPLTTTEDFLNKELKKKWNQREEKEIEKIKDTLFEVSTLNKISVDEVWEQPNTGNYAGIISADNKIGEDISINLKQEQFVKVKQEIIKIISRNSSDWKIIESRNEKVVYHVSSPPKLHFLSGLKGKNGKIHYRKGFTEKEWKEIENLVENRKQEKNMNPNYTIENFEKWLNADKLRKKGLWGWGLIISKVKSDSDLFNSLATGQDLGGWNISDPKFRKQYQFEDYYQVFVEWKKEMDAKNGEIDETDSKPNEEEENEPNYSALSITKQEREYEDNPPLAISSVGTINIKKDTNQMPFGSVLLTDTGTSSKLKNQGINHIIHAAMMPLLKNRNNEKEFIKVATLAIQNSIILAERQKFSKLATCFLGGNLYCPVEEVKPDLAEAIIRASLNQLEKCSHLEKIIFVDFDGDYYKDAWEKIEQEGNYSEIIKKTKVKKGDLLKKVTHKAEVIINSENAEMEWRSGISGAIGNKLGSEANEVDQQRKKLMKEFYHISEKTKRRNNTNQSLNDKNLGWRIISSPWTWLVIIILVGLLAWRKLRSYLL